ncbi:hypothetical protein [Kiloniella litopenaei]|uniref:hypothetical protein n=1 Tax=Kiloniella litopenaei TaxID=1549748 RepID=UPI003BAA208B
MKKIKFGDDLSAFQKVFCESREALERCFENGLPANAEILCRSPILHQENSYNTILLDDRIDPPKMQEFYLGIDDFCQTCFKVLDSDSTLSFLSRTFTQQIWLWHAELIKSAFVQSGDLTEPCLIVDTGGQSTPAPPWLYLLQNNPEAHVITIPVTVKSRLPAHRKTPKELFERLQVEGWRHLVWFAGRKLSRIIPEKLSSGTVYVSRYNELLRDIGVEFLLRGFKVKELARPDQKIPGSKAGELADRAMVSIASLAKGRLALLVAPEIADLTLQNLRKLFAQEIEVYLSNSRNAFNSSGNSLILANFPWSGFAEALFRCSLEQNVVFAGFQHGITREVLANRQNQINYENVIPEYFGAIARESEKTSNTNPFKRSPKTTSTVALGAPSDLVSYTKKTKPKPHARGIVYPSAMNLTGYFFNGGVFQSDVQNVIREKELFDKVLSKSAHPFFYKPYPVSRYADANPLIEQAQQHENIRVLQTGKDLRFMLRDYQAVMTVGASSTLSWCLLAGLPVIYIDSPHEGFRLNSQARNYFLESGFYFDSLAPDFHRSLLSFLQQDIENIQGLWQDSEAQHDLFKREFMGLHSYNAGANGYKWLRSLMQEHGKTGNASK